MVSLLPNGKLRGESVNNRLLSSRQKLLEARSRLRAAEEYFESARRSVVVAENEFRDSLKDFDSFYEGCFD